MGAESIFASSTGIFSCPEPFGVISLFQTTNMRSVRQSRLLWLALCAGVGPLAPQARAIITFGGTGNEFGTPPGNVGIYEGSFNGYTGTAITSNMLISANHLLLGFNNTFVYNNGTMTATTYAVQVVASLDDLSVLQIAPNQSGTFTLSAPIYTGSGEAGSTMVDVGKGYARGGVTTGGWGWVANTMGSTWGTNTVSAIDTDTELGLSGAFGGDFLQYDFDNEDPSSPNYNADECIVTPGDSGGGVFIDVGGQYQLAGVNSLVDGAYDSMGNLISGSLYDAYGYYEKDSNNNLVEITQHVPESSFATRISSKLNFVGLADGTIPSANAAAYPINDDGQLTVYSNLTTGAITGGASITVGNGTNANPKLKIASNSGGSAISSLIVDSGSTLDITNNHIFIAYGSATDPIASIAAWIASGYAGGTWTGLGITSSAAQSNSGSYGIGYADSADPGNPAGLSSGTIEIKYTLLGDANLDGKVNGTDFTILATNFNRSVTDGWDEGDFNYDGKVNGGDFLLLAQNFNQSASQSASQSAVSAADMGALDAFAAANGLSVPEPGSAGMLVVAALGILHRRRSALSSTTF
jgi:hypothetical protein